MEDDILKKIKEEYQLGIQRQIEYKNIQKRLKELEKEDLVKEYLSLLEISQSSSFNKLLNIKNRDLMDSIAHRYLYKIKETNGVYVYAGTFCYSNEWDIMHSWSDIRLNYYDDRAQYRLYQDIEQSDGLVVPISKCCEFEEKNKVVFWKDLLKELF